MKKLFCLLILSIILLTGCQKKEDVKKHYDQIIERDYIIAGIKTDSPPFGFINKETGNEEGFDVDIAKEIAKEILGSERKIKYVSVTPNTRIEAITSGAVDIVVATMSVTPQRQYLIDFSKPYYIAGQTALVRKDSNIHTFADLKDKTTLIILGSNSERNIRNIIPTANIIGYKNYEEAFNALKDNKADALSSDDTILSGLIINDNNFRLLKNRISREYYAVGFKKDDDYRLKDNIDVVITRMHNNGKIKELKRKWNLY